MHTLCIYASLSRVQYTSLSHTRRYSTLSPSSFIIRCDIYRCSHVIASKERSYPPVVKSYADFCLQRSLRLRPYAMTHQDWFDVSFRGVCFTITIDLHYSTVMGALFDLSVWRCHEEWSFLFRKRSGTYRQKSSSFLLSNASPVESLEDNPKLEGYDKSHS